MPAVPRIARGNPGPDITVLPEPQPVIAYLHWYGLGLQAARAWAIATSPTATQIVWLFDDGPRTDWLRHQDVDAAGTPITARPRMSWEDPARLRPDVRPGPPRPGTRLGGETLGRASDA